MWVYSQRTGVLNHDGEFVGRGYAGREAGKNNPAMQNVKGIGPIPQGDYIIEAPRGSATVGKYAMRLIPVDPSKMFGRDSMNMHGDSSEHPGLASHGCIVMPHDVRVQVWESGDHRLRSTP